MSCACAGFVGICPSCRKRLQIAEGALLSIGQPVNGGLCPCGATQAAREALGGGQALADESARDELRARVGELEALVSKMSKGWWEDRELLIETAARAVEKSYRNERANIAASNGVRYDCVSLDAKIARQRAAEDVRALSWKAR